MRFQQEKKRKQTQRLHTHTQTSLRKFVYASLNGAETEAVFRRNKNI